MGLKLHPKFFFTTIELIFMIILIEPFSKTKSKKLDLKNWEKSENVSVLAFLNSLYLTVFEPLSVPRFDEKLIL